MDISGYVVLGIVTLFFLYLMPQLIRSRQDVVDSRVDDRFSTDLRILATAGTVGAPPRPVFDDGAPRAYLHDPRLRTEVSAMNRPAALAPRAASSTTTHGAPVSAPRPTPATDRARAAARVEASRRRRAAARRRLVLTLVLLVASAAAWGAVAAGFTVAAVAVVPTVLLAVVLVLGRRAAVAGQRIERAERAAAGPAPARVGEEPRSARTPRPTPAQPRVEARPGAGGRSHDASTELIPRVEGSPWASGLSWNGMPTAPDVEEVGDDAAPIVSTARAEVAPTARVAAAAQDPAPEGSWTPVPVPVPTYTLKPTAPRLDAAPLQLDQPTAPAEAAADEAPPARALDLDAVLSRRRAAGE